MPPMLRIFIALLFMLPSAELLAKIPNKSVRGKRDFLLVAGGDVAYPRGWMESLVIRQGHKMFDDVRGYAKVADLAFVNLESPYTNAEFTLKKKWPIASAPERLDYVLDGGFNLFSLANNHMFDTGEQGISDTLELLKKKRRKYKNLWWSGTALKAKDAVKPAIFTVPGKSLKVVFHSFGYAGSRLVASPNPKYSVERVKKYASQGDITIVSVHHGKEYQHIPKASKAALFRKYIDAGAHIVLGHHPHVVQGVEAYKNGIIFHSLGNFSFASKTRRHHKTGAKLYSMLPLIYVKNGVVERAEVLPLWANNSESWTLGGKKQKVANFKPTLLKGAFATAMLTDLRKWTRAIPDVHERAGKAFRIVGERAVIQVRRK
jgi:poly-gamma-glutamate synthesis protein (capsule biosynthesis protein)